MRESSYQVGDILSYSWGYDQTNIDFFVVVKRTESAKGVVFLTLQEVAASVSDEVGFMTYKTVPARDGDGNVIPKPGKPIRRKLHVDTRGGGRREIGVAINSYGWCSTWSGNPVTMSTYA